MKTRKEQIENLVTKTCKKELSNPLNDEQCEVLLKLGFSPDEIRTFNFEDYVEFTTTRFIHDFNPDFDTEPAGNDLNAIKTKEGDIIIMPNKDRYVVIGSRLKIF